MYTDEVIKQKAIEIIGHYYGIVYPYVGSSYLTGTEYPDVKFKRAKDEALYLVDSMINMTSHDSPSVVFIYYDALYNVIFNFKFEDYDFENNKN